MLAALIQQEGGVVPAVLEKLGVQPRNAAPAGRDRPERPGRAAGPTQVYVSPRFRRLFEAAQAEAERLKDDYVSTEHFLLALADDQEQGPAGQVLRRAGVTRDRVYAGAAGGARRPAGDQPRPRRRPTRRWRSTAAT